MLGCWCHVLWCRRVLSSLRRLLARRLLARRLLARRLLVSAGSTHPQTLCHATRKLVLVFAGFSFCLQARLRARGLSLPPCPTPSVCASPRSCLYHPPQTHSTQHTAHTYESRVELFVPRPREHLHANHAPAAHVRVCVHFEAFGQVCVEVRRSGRCAWR